eukprot:6194418-Alexandrium_andersonii.AAC.1
MGLFTRSALAQPSRLHPSPTASPARQACPHYMPSEGQHGTSCCGRASWVTMWAHPRLQAASTMM